MLLFLVVVIFTGGIPAEWQELAWGALALFGLALAGIYALVLWPRQLQRASSWLISAVIPIRFRVQAGQIANRLILSFATINSVGSITGVLLLSILVWAFETGMYRTMMLAFGLDVGFHHLMLMSAAANLATWGGDPDTKVSRRREPRDCLRLPAACGPLVHRNGGWALLHVAHRHRPVGTGSNGGRGSAPGGRWRSMMKLEHVRPPRVDIQHGVGP
jgi:hypothetical protein